MLSDIFNLVGELALLVSLGIFFFATYRAVQIGRVLMRGVYRSRAFWSAGTMTVIIISTLVGYLPSAIAVSGFLDVLGLIVFFTFVDSSVRVAQDMDFFHRSTLSWQRLRKPFYILLFASAAIALWAGYLASPDTLLAMVGGAQFYLVIGPLYVYSAAALFLGARKTPDRTMRRFVKTLGLALACVAIYLTIWIPFTPFSVTVQDLGAMISYFFVPAAAYFLYLAVMSLSPVGRVEEEVDATTIQGESSVILPSHP
jgi:hypothetical protein